MCNSRSPADEWDDDVGAIQVDHSDQGGRGVEAERAVADHSYLAVGALDDGIRQFHFEEAANRGPVAFDRRGELAKGLEAASPRPCIPFGEQVVGLRRARHDPIRRARKAWR